jgi:hypothetical protein
MPDLRVWVERLVDRFAIDIRAVPPCWEQHNGIVEALSALRDHERGSYAADADPRSAVDWLRALREVRGLLAELARSRRSSPRPSVGGGNGCVTKAGRSRRRQGVPPAPGDLQRRHRRWPSHTESLSHQGS